MKIFAKFSGIFYIQAKKSISIYIFYYYLEYYYEEELLAALSNFADVRDVYFVCDRRRN